MRMLIITSETLLNPSRSNASNGRLFMNSPNNFKHCQKIFVSVQLDRSNCFFLFIWKNKNRTQGKEIIKNLKMS